MKISARNALKGNVVKLTQVKSTDVMIGKP
jgi:molybdopterin-binding protein